MALHKRWIRCASALALAVLSWQAQAATFEMDSFSVSRNGSVIFFDAFSDGAPPPSAPDFLVDPPVPGSYSTAGTFGPESRGLLQLNTAQGVLTTNATGAARRALRAALDTNTSNDPSLLGRGLKDDDTLVLKGTFNLGVPVGPLLNGYAIRFSDRPNVAGGVVSQAADLNVIYNPDSGKAELVWILQNFSAGTNTAFGRTELALPDGGADQIQLQIERPDLASNLFFASWTFFKSGAAAGSGSFATGIGLFNGERFVRAEFLAFSAVPLPGTLWLLGAGLLAGLGFARRRRA